MKALISIKVGAERRRYQLEEGELATIGRGSGCPIRVRDQSVSREHCVAVFANGKVCISDLASTHGVKLDGESVGRCELVPGASCQLGSARLRFESIDGEAPPAAPPVAARPEPEFADESEPASAAESTPAPAPASARSEGAPEATEPAAAEGSEVKVAGYRVLEELGAGGFGVVYRAQQVRLGREVALKVLRLDEADDVEAKVEAFAREARAAAAINDPHLVQVFDVGQDHGTHYLSMELVTGGSLARRLKRRGPMEWREVMELVRDVAQALQAAHRSGLVHRDVKPANILLTDAGQAKLTDLGLASGLVAAGTVAFMAPEQLLRREVDARADIYALGCTAYAALAGRAPFTGSKDDVARSHLKQVPESLSRLGLQVPWHFEQLVIDSMMAKDVADRPQTAAELLERLDRLILPGQGVRAAAAATAARRAPDAPIRVRVPASRQKQLMARIASELVVVTIVAVMVIATLLALKIGWPDLDIYRLIGK